MKERRIVVWSAAAFMLKLCRCSSSAADVTAVPADSYPSFVEEACKDFSSGTQLSSGWQHADCVDVWTSWIRTLPRFLFVKLNERELMREPAAELRRRGAPCLVQSPIFGDGVGSATIRYLASWMYAEEVGCDWIKPVWRKKELDADGTILYCHRTTNIAEWEAVKRGDAELDPTTMRCALHNWVKYFHFESHTVGRPTNGTFMSVEAQPARPVQLQGALDELKITGFEGRSWEHLEIVLESGMANHYAQNVRSWDDFKRGKVRNILQRFKQSFQEFPRPWYDQQPECSYGTSQLDFAMHLRLGDRSKLIEEDFNEYVALLEAFMDKVTKSLVSRGHDKPVFHVFSETSLPCPSSGSGIFDELPTWPVEIDQIPPCLVAETPEDCPEKKWGESCSPRRSGIFRVQGRPMFLHIGLDVQNAMSCMSQADGLLMGCSTFGHVAGLLTSGISFFSTECEGVMSPVQYKMVPPLAIAERGHLWVPVSGSWRTPVLSATHIFEVALDEMLRNKGITS